MKERYLEDRLFVIIWSIFVALNALLLVLVFLAPLLEHWGADVPSGALYRFLHLLCHQRPERSWFICGEKLGACVRCLATYVLIIPSAAILFAEPVRAWLARRSFLRFVLPLSLALLSPLVIDGFVQLLTPWESTPLLRFVTGGLAGTGITAAAGYAVLKFSRMVENSLAH